MATDGRHTIRQTIQSDRNGIADLHFRPGYAGTWAVILIQDGHSSHFDLDVR